MTGGALAGVGARAGAAEQICTRESAVRAKPVIMVLMEGILDYWTVVWSVSLEIYNNGDVIWRLVQGLLDRENWMHGGGYGGVY